jgi:hypothetical protein
MSNVDLAAQDLEEFAQRFGAIVMVIHHQHAKR